MRLQIVLDGVPLFDSGDRDHAKTAVKAIAAVYAGLTDDEQAQFFEDVAAVIDEWDPAMKDRQLWYIGRHMRTCSCIGAGARDMLNRIHSAMEYTSP